MSETKRPAAKSPKRRTTKKTAPSKEESPQVEGQSFQKTAEGEKLMNEETLRENFQEEVDDSDGQEKFLNPSRPRPDNRRPERGPGRRDDRRPERNESRAVETRDVAREERRDDRREPSQGDRSEAPRLRPADEYTTTCFYDKATKQFMASTVEFPQIRAVGSNRELALKDLSGRLDSHLSQLRNRGELPDPIQSFSYPDFLEVPISQSLYRRLDVLSRQEKTALDTLVVELLSQAVEKRFEPQRNHGPSDRNFHKPQQQGGGRPNHSQHNRPPRDRQQAGHRGPNPNSRRGGYHESLEQSDNFLEYVRNLEKNGGRWRGKK